MTEQQFDLQSIIQEAVGQKIDKLEEWVNELAVGIEKVDTLEASIEALDVILSSSFVTLIGGIIAQDAKTSEWCLGYLRMCCKAGILDVEMARTMFSLQHGNSPTMRERFEKVVGPTIERKGENDS